MTYPLYFSTNCICIYIYIYNETLFSIDLRQEPASIEKKFEEEEENPNIRLKASCMDLHTYTLARGP